MNPNQVFQLLKKINSFYPNRLPKDPGEVDEMIQSYHAMLEGADIMHVMGNLKNHVANKPHPPTIADLLGNTDASKKDPPRPSIPTAEETRRYMKEQTLLLTEGASDKVAIQTAKERARSEIERNLKEVEERRKHEYEYKWR